MANTNREGPNGHANHQDIRLARLAESSMINVSERSIDEWDVADTAQRLIEFDDEPRAHMSPEEYAESDARFAAFWVQHEERALGRCRALHNQNYSEVNQDSRNTRTRPSDSQFGSDGNQYNPYAPHTSEEYMLQEIEAGRMDPEMTDIPRNPSNIAQPPLSRNGPGLRLAHFHAGGNTSWMAPGHRPPYRQGLNGRGVSADVSDTHEESWLQHPYDSSTAAEDLVEEEYPDVYPAMLPYLDARGIPAGSHSRYGTTPNPVLPNQESPVGVRGPLTSPLDPSSLNEIFALGVPRQSHPASIGRERKRLAKPSLVVKLKTDFMQKSSQASVSIRRGRSDASWSSESSSAARTTQNSRPFNLRSEGSVGMNSANARTRAGWEPHAERRLTRRVEGVQSSQRKRRRDAVSPQEVDTEGPITPTASLPRGK